jgi:hypothetical protein
MRSKTSLRYVDKNNKKVTRVTYEDGKYFIGDTNERAEGKMTHYKGVRNFTENKVHQQKEYNEWSDYAYTSEDF